MKYVLGILVPELIRSVPRWIASIAFAWAVYYLVHTVVIG